MEKRKFITTALLLLLNVPALLTAQEAEDELFKKATRYYFQKKFAMAEVLLKESINKDPENALSYSYLADIYLNKQQYDAALNLYKRALDLAPQSAENHFRLGQVYYRKKLGNLAIEEFKKALELDQQMKYAHYHIGLAYLMLERNKPETLHHWKLYLALAPEDPQYENLRRVVSLLEDPNFKIPPVGSEISIEEALLLGGQTLTKQERKTEHHQAGQEDRKTREKLEDIYLDDGL